MKDTRLSLTLNEYTKLIKNGFLKLDYEHTTFYIHTELIKINAKNDVLIHIHEVDFSVLYKRTSTSPKTIKHFLTIEDINIIDN